jgi:superfamily II DNA or RNA helicase
MATSTHNSTQKERSRKRTEKIKDLISKVEKGLLKVVSVPNTNGRVLTIMDPNNDCFHSEGKYLYLGTSWLQLKQFGDESTPKLGKAELAVGQTISGPRNRYTDKNPFVVIDVITVDEKTLDKFGVKTVRQLEEKIRKDNGFIKHKEFDGDEFWMNKKLGALVELVHNYLFEGKTKETYEPRIPQKRAIEKMIDAFTKGMYKEFLLGAIMSFGKNFTFLYTVVEILKNKPIARILVWTNKPSVFKTLKDDVNGHIKFSDYEYLSMKDSKDIQVLPHKCVVTVSKQLLENDKNEDVLNFITSQKWDFIIIDETHNGVETEKGQQFLKKFKDTRKIFISGTPQKQLGKVQFNDENTFIYDEVLQKEDKKNGIWSDSIILKTQLIELSADNVNEYKKYVCDVEGYFTFKKFFSTNKNGLVYQQSVLKFFKDFFGYTNKFDDTYNFFGKHNHVAIMVPSNVNATKMIMKLLEDSEIGEDYVIVAATGSRFKRSQLETALLSGKKTITLLSDMLIEGETVPEWDCAINMSDGTSIFKYLQFAFRPTRPNKCNPNKEAYFYDMNPQRHFLIQNERMKMNGMKGKEKDEALKEWYKNFKIMMGSTVKGMVDVNFDFLKTESYNFRNMMRSIGSLMFWDGIDIDEISNDLNGVEKQTLPNERIILNDNGINGGKNNKVITDKENKNNITEKELKDIQDKWVTIMSRAPYVLHRAQCDTIDCLLEKYKDMEGRFEGAFKVSQKVFEKYWNNPNFIDKYEMDFYFKNYAESI